MKKLIFFAVILSCMFTGISSAKAEWKFNPFTGKMDYFEKSIKVPFSTYSSFQVQRDAGKLPLSGGTMTGAIRGSKPASFGNMSGTSWNGYKPVVVVGQSGSPVSVGGTLSEITLADVLIPGGLMGMNGSIRLAFLHTFTNSSNNKIVRVYFGSKIISGVTLTTNVIGQGLCIIRNSNNTAVQVAFGNGNSSPFAPFTIIGGNSNNGGTLGNLTINTAIDQHLYIKGITTLETGFTPTTGNISGNGSTVTVIYTAHGLNTGEYIKAAGSSTSGYNVDPVQVTKVDANTFTYVGTGSGTPATSPTIQRYSVITLDGYTVEFLPGAN